MEKDEDDQESFFLPAEDQRVWGAGIKRKRVPFVAATPTETTVSSSPSKPVNGAGDRYLSIVLPTQAPPAESAQAHPLCTVCSQPITSSHESSITHQLCLTHSHPPSHLPRTHVGLQILSASGWDPDSRLGLGVSGSGIRVPIKGKVKNDTVGLGVEMKGKRRKEKENEVVKRLNAKQVRKGVIEEKKRAEKLREGFYGRDLEEYLGPGG